MITDFLKYLLEHPQALRVLGIITVTLILAPVIIIWLRAGYIRRVVNSYGGIIDDMNDKVILLYRDITQVREELANTRGELAITREKLREAESVSSRQQSEINRLRAKMKELQAKETLLLKKINKYESDNES